MFEGCLYFNLNALTRAVNRVWEEEFARLELSPAHGFLLRLVLSKPGLLQREVAAELGLARSTVTRFVDALVERGYLRREQSVDDRREQRVLPTAKARRLHELLEASGARLTERLSAQLGPQEFTRLVQTVRKARRTLEPKA